MKHLLIITSVVVFGAAAVAAQQGAPMRAHAESRARVWPGTAVFVERDNGTGKEVEVTLNVSGLKPGRHGVHLHAVGKCSPDFQPRPAISIRVPPPTRIRTPITPFTWATCRTSWSAPRARLR